VAASTSNAPSDRAALASTSTAIDTPIIAPARIAHSKKVAVGRHRHESTGRPRIVLWRANATAVPNPGGGFYGPPNFNVGYINPR
jgi:hypothetical protein